MNILLVDNHKLFSQGLHTLLEKNPHFNIVGEASNGRIAVKMALELKPDLIIMDIGMPELNGIEAARQIKTEMPDVMIIAVSMHDERQYISRMLAAGASGYVFKDSAFDELNEAIQVVKKGGRYLSPRIVNIVVEDFFQKTAPLTESVFDKLSAREREVLQMIAEGHTTAHIATSLFVSKKTIESHRKNLMTKLGVNSVAELTKVAIKEGLTSLDIASEK